MGHSQLYCSFLVWEVGPSDDHSPFLSKLFEGTRFNRPRKTSLDGKKPKPFYRISSSTRALGAL